MQTYISILRSINVSGQKIIKMDDLKRLHRQIGFIDIQTYIQSGNVIFKADPIDEQHLVQTILEQIRINYQFDVPVMVKPVEEWNEVFQNNPFLPEKQEEIDKLHVTFLSDAPEPGLMEEIFKLDSEADQFILRNKTIYLYCPNGYGRTKLTNNFFEKKLNLRSTTRNWKTVAKLMELLEKS